jgi:ribonuclease PH
VAAADAVNKLRPKANWPTSPIRDAVAAVSVGIVGGVPMLDL